MAEAIICPKCGCDVTEVLTVQLKSQIRHDLALEWRDKESELTAQKSTLEKQRLALAEERSAIDAEIAQKLAIEKKRLKAKAMKKARQRMSAELKASQDELLETQAKLQEAKTLELQLRKERMSLEEEKKNLELTVTRKLDEERAAIRDKVRREADEEHRLKDAEKEKLVGDMRKEIDQLRRTMEQGSQQLQGEVLELDLEELLREQFPADDIKPVPKGIRGADVIQLVRDSVLAECGAIIWESKRTANWSHTWLQKLRDDMRAADACIAILVSEKLHPKMVTGFDSIDGIWVTNRECATGLATALRCGLLDVAAARRALQGQQGKMEALYDYLSSTTFKNRVTGIVEAFSTMQTDLVKEKKAVTAAWAKREQQINQALKNTSGMYGDLRGIIGGNLHLVESLEFPALPSSEGEPEEALAGAVLPR